MGFAAILRTRVKVTPPQKNLKVTSLETVKKKSSSRNTEVDFYDSVAPGELHSLGQHRS
jgi:hypothetical protein